MNLITFKNHIKTRVIERKGSIRESIGWLHGYIQGLADRDIYILAEYDVTLEYVNNNGIKKNVDWHNMNADGSYSNKN